MATRSELTQAVYDELVAVMDARSDTSSSETHVVLQDEDLPETPPALSVQFSETPQTSGDSKQTRVVEHVENSDGEIVDVRYADDKTLTVDVTCLAQKDHTAVSVYEDVRQWFNAFDRARPSTDLAAGVDNVDVNDGSPQSEDGRRGHIVRIEIDYEETFLRSDVTGSQFTPVRSVDTTIDTGSDSTTSTTQ